MLKRYENRRTKIFCSTLEELMPKNHFLRDLDRLVDFTFIYDKIENLYSNTGRPSIDPVIIVKMLLLGYLYGIDSERKLEQEIHLNIAYRWFLGIGLDTSVPDHSTISQLRRRKFKNTDIFQELFDEIVRKCIDVGLVDGKLLLTDATHIRANARNDLRKTIEVPDEPSEYMKSLDKEAYETGLIKEPIKYEQTQTKQVIKSITDPESGLLKRPGKPIAFCYLSHQTCDSQHGIITDVFVTSGNVKDSIPHRERIEYQINKFNFKTKAICADGGYDSCEIYHHMFQQNIKTYIPRRKKPQVNPNYEANFDCDKFIYNKEKNIYICPANKELSYSCFNKKSRVKRYTAKKSDCQTCHFKTNCIGKSKNERRIERHLHEESRQEQVKNIITPEYFIAMRLRKIWCEGNFSHQKERHNLKRTRKRGIEKVTEQCLLSACALNLKRLVKAMKIAATNLFDLYLIINKVVWMRVCQQHRIVTPLYRNFSV